MDCDKCKKHIDFKETGFAIGEKTGDSVEIRFACPACGERYFAFCNAGNFIVFD